MAAVHEPVHGHGSVEPQNAALLLALVLEIA